MNEHGGLDGAEEIIILWHLWGNRPASSVVFRNLHVASPLPWLYLGCKGSLLTCGRYDA